jgi:hypothetical protein
LSSETKTIEKKQLNEITLSSNHDHERTKITLSRRHKHAVAIFIVPVRRDRHIIRVHFARFNTET